jgi:hypothetical protein
MEGRAALAHTMETIVPVTPFEIVNFLPNPASTRSRASFPVPRFQSGGNIGDLKNPPENNLG